MGAIAKWVFGIPPRETSFQKRGFRGGTNGARERIERIGSVFMQGYHAALVESRQELLARELEKVEMDFRGFAYEGAAMGLALLDRITPWRRNRLQDFLRGPGEPHAYMLHVAVGWVVARLPSNITKVLAPLDPILRWLVLDGYGFHEGFFHWPRYLNGGPIPERVLKHGTPRTQQQSRPYHASRIAYAPRVFDQGLGRSFWFVDGADVNLIPQTIAAFPVTRQADLWSGIGLASVYAGEISDHSLESLRASAGGFWPQLAQGGAFAAKARQRAVNLTPYTERACAAICGMSAAEAARVTDDALENLPANGTEPAFEAWRCRIQQKFAQLIEVKR